MAGVDVRLTVSPEEKRVIKPHRNCLHAAVSSVYFQMILDAEFNEKTDYLTYEKILGRDLYKF